MSFAYFWCQKFSIAFLNAALLFTQVIDAELNELQGRVQRCAAACADEARDMVPPGAGAQSPEVLKAQDKLDDCACWSLRVID